MFKRKLLIVNTSIILGLSGTIAIPSVLAETTEEKIEQANENIERVEDELSQLEQQIQRVDEAMRDNNKMIVQTEEDIESTTKQVEKLENEISELNDSIDKRKVILAERAVAYQESGGSVEYLEVLAGAKNFGDFVNRVYAVTQIVNADKDLIDQFEEDKASLEEKKATVNKKLDELTSLKTELDGMKKLIEKQKEQNGQLKEELEKEKQNNINKKNELEATQQVRVQSSASQTNSTSKSKSAPVNNPSTKNKGSVETVINAGYKYIGNSVYVWGGGRNQYDIDHGRFDCSGFVHWAFGQAGYKVGSSTSQLTYSGTRVSPANMKPGDIVFFNTYKTDGHVGIYIGNGQFIGSQSSTGVSIENMSSGYWASVFNGRVNRVIK